MAQVSPLVQISFIPSPKHCGVEVGRCVGVWVSVGVIVGVRVIVGVGVGDDNVPVGVGVGVKVRCLVPVTVGVSVSLGVAVEVRVAVPVIVGVLAIVGVANPQSPAHEPVATSTHLKSQTPLMSSQQNESTPHTHPSHCGF